MSLFLAKKQEDANQKKVRDLLRLKENKKCFDCPTKSPAFVNTTIQTFICSRCSGLVREVGHRVKAVSASKFSGAEVLALKQGGNGTALKIWLSNYSTHDSPEPEADADVRAFMRQKYYENKWLDRALLQSHKEKVRDLIAKNFTEDGLPIVTKSRTKFTVGFSRLPLIADSEMNIMHDDEYHEEQLESDHRIIAASTPVPFPRQQMPESYMNPHNPITPQMPSVTPPAVANAPMESGRASMESNCSGHSSSTKSLGTTSVHSGRGSQDMTRINDGASKTSATGNSSPRESSESAHSSSTNTSATMVLTSEQIAERCKSTMGSDSPEAKAIAAAQLLAEQQKLEQEQYQQQQLQYEMYGFQQHQYPQQQPYIQQPYQQELYTKQSQQQPYIQQSQHQTCPQQPQQQSYQLQPHQHLYQQQPHKQPYQQQSYRLQPHQQPYVPQPSQQPYQQQPYSQNYIRQQQSEHQLSNQQRSQSVSVAQDPIAQDPIVQDPIVQDSYAVSEKPQSLATDKSSPPLRIDVPRTTKDLVYHQHPNNSQVKPSPVNFGNNVQSPTTISISGNGSASASPVVTPSTSKVRTPASPSNNAFDSILSDLAGLKLEKTVRRATYTGGILSPTAPAISPLTPSSSTSALKTKQDDKATCSTSMFDPDFFSNLNKSSEQKISPENDPYAALRGIPAPVVATPETVKEDEKNTSSSEEEDDDWQDFCSSSVGENDDFATPSQLVQPTVENTKPATSLISVDLFSDLDPRSMFKRF